MKLGFNLSINGKTVGEVKQEIAEYATVGTEAIELSLTKAEGILDFPFPEIYKDLLQFEYRSLHIPVVFGTDQHDKRFIKYPDAEIAPHLKVIQRIAQDLDIAAYVVHPDQISDYAWAVEQFGDLLGFENMDSRKQSGKSVQDMETVFSKCPDAKWIFDINHLYTNDPSMVSAKEFYLAFRDRLTHYHVSAFGGFHSSFTKNPQELIILKGVLDPSVPMIHEGYDYSDHNLKEEYSLIVNTLTGNPPA